ncbi:hypothetical protein [Methanosarcina sp.]|uniref:hypothetical protein n=1 Tax=Methanosarcina sp. TaxID=2213 RepID=UPI002AB8EAB9|nr:hypothetical protein [Methanosarcina sp.]MDY9927800.1 hypothetical protein [Methanosarcina sp.]
MEEHLFRWDEIRWGKVTEKDKKRIIEFVIHNYDPKLSLSAKIEKFNLKAIKITDEKSTPLILETDKDKLNVKIAEKIDELILKKGIDKKDSKEFTVYPVNSPQGPDDRFVMYIGIVLILTYLFLFFAIIIYSLVQFWPHPAFIDGKANFWNSPVSPVIFFEWSFEPTDEERLLLIVAFAGALGSLVHALRSFYWYVGDRDLVMSWLAMSIPLPVIGALIGFFFYITILRGLFSHAETPPIESMFGFIAISALVGMFSVQAALKLCNIVYSMFTKLGESRIQDSR